MTGYVNMDHAGWVQRQNEGAKRRGGKPKVDKNGFPIGPLGSPDILSPFQARVMDILGIIGGGIYNAPISWDTVSWNYGGGVAVTWGGGLASFDKDQLTSLVFLCHEARIRVDVNPHGFRYLRLTFYQRGHEGGIGRRHPNLDEAVAEFRDIFEPGHTIVYRPLPSEGGPQ